MWHFHTVVVDKIYWSVLLNIAQLAVILRAIVSATWRIHMLINSSLYCVNKNVAGENYFLSKCICCCKLAEYKCTFYKTGLPKLDKRLDFEDPL